MGHDRSGTSLKSIHLAFRIAGSRVLMAAPVIKYLWDMDDLFCLLSAAEDKVIILGSVKFLAEAAYLV